MFDWIRRLFQARPSVRWIRKEHEQERKTAMRLGLLAQSHQVDATGQLYLDVVVTEPGAIGAILLVGLDEKVYVHRSSKRKGYWQASWMRDGVMTGNDREYRRLQEALDRLREKGYVVHSLMTRGGELRE